MNRTEALVVTSSFLPGHGGIENYLHEICSYFAPRLAVFAPAERDEKPIPDDLGYRTIGHQGSLLVPDRRVLAAIERAANDVGTDRLMFGTPWPLALLAPALAEKGFAYSVIVYGAELLVPSAVPGVRQRLLRALEGAEHIFTVSAYTRDRLAQMMSRAKRTAPPMDPVLPTLDLERFNPDVDGSEVREQLKVSDDDKLILYFGRLVERKGAHRLIGMIPALNERVKNAVVLIAGVGPEDGKLRRLARESPGRVIFTGRVPDEAAPAVYAAADLFALPVADRYMGLEVEGLGIVTLEAAACGVPAIAGRSGGSPEAVIDGETGFVVNAKKMSELVDRAATILEDEELANRMGRNARAYVERKFDRDRQMAPIAEWLDRGPS